MEKSSPSPSDQPVVSRLPVEDDTVLVKGVADSSIERAEPVRIVGLGVLVRVQGAGA